MALYGSGQSTRLAVAAAGHQEPGHHRPQHQQHHRRFHADSGQPDHSLHAASACRRPPKTVTRPCWSTATTAAPASSSLIWKRSQSPVGWRSRTTPSGAAVSDVQTFVEQGIVVLVGGKFSGSAAVTVVDLADRSFSAFGTTSELSLPTFETRSPSRLWHVDQSTGLCYLNLVARPKSAALPDGEARLTTAETWLDQPISAIVPLAQPDTPRYLVVTHADPYALGNLTILDAEKPDRTQARTAYGFLLSNYLEREQP